MSEQKCHHEWVADQRLCDRVPAYECSQCGDACAACVICERPTSSALVACDPCLKREREVLDQIVDALGHWEQQPASPVPAIRYDLDRRGGNADYVPVREPDGPWEIHAVLRDWREAWTDASRDVREVSDVDYLRGHIMWAVHNRDESGWNAYHAEMRQLRHRARRMAHLLPQRQSGSCIYCGGTVVRDWADEQWRPRADGLSDALRCTDCRTEWADPEKWRFANRHTILALPQTQPQQLVTMEHARAIFPQVPAPTWRSWVFRDAKRGEAVRAWQEKIDAGHVGPFPEPERMPVRSWDFRGVALYLLADLTAHVEARASDTRPGRKAS